MTATVTEPTGARARQTYYWRVRNARTRALARQRAAQAWHIQPGHPGGAYCDLGHELDPPAHHTPTPAGTVAQHRDRAVPGRVMLG